MISDERRNPSEGTVPKRIQRDVVSMKKDDSVVFGDDSIDPIKRHMTI